MAHNINRSNGRDSLYLLKEKAWHGLGTVVEEARSTEEVIKLSGLGYEVRKARVYANFVDEDEVIVLSKEDRLELRNKETGLLRHVNKKGEQVKNAFVTYRADTGVALMSGKVVTSQYSIVQNINAFEFVDSISKDAQIQYETAGALGKGERIFVTAKLPSNIRIKGDDSLIEKYLLFTSTHDGTGQVEVMFTPTRVVCNNTLTFAMDRATNKIKIKHTGNIQDKLKFALDMLNLYDVYQSQQVELLNYLADIPVNTQQVKDSLYPLVFTSEELGFIKSNNGSYIGIQEISTNKTNKMSAILGALDNGVGQNTNRGTALWMVNGLTSYYQNTKTYKNQEEKLDCIISGEANRNLNKLVTSLY